MRKKVIQCIQLKEKNLNQLLHLNSFEFEFEFT